MRSSPTLRHLKHDWIFIVHRAGPWLPCQKPALTCCLPGTASPSCWEKNCLICVPRREIKYVFLISQNVFLLTFLQLSLGRLPRSVPVCPAELCSAPLVSLCSPQAQS